jgi:hypothetical protein
MLLVVCLPLRQTYGLEWENDGKIEKEFALFIYVLCASVLAIRRSGDSFHSFDYQYDRFGDLPVLRI